MNKRDARGRLPAISHNHRLSIGQSIVEFSVAVSVLSLMLVIVADFARVFYLSIAVNNAARAGAQYGSQTVITAADVAGMKTAATTDGSNIPSLTPTASQCTCESQTSSVTKCPSSYCTANTTATFVEVDTSAPFTTILEVSRSSEFIHADRQSRDAGGAMKRRGISLRAGEPLAPARHWLNSPLRPPSFCCCSSASCKWRWP